MMTKLKNLSPILFLVFILLSCGPEQASTNIDAADEPLTEETENTVDITEEIDVEAQWANEREGSIADFANAVIDDNISLASQYFEFPFKREAPLPPVKNAAEFETYFTTLFDDELKQKLQEHLDNPDIIDLSMSNGTTGILNGLIWFNDSGTEVISINYQSAAEKELYAEVDEKVRNSMHPILGDYEYNVFLGRTKEGLFRIDETEKGLRYASWYGDQNLLDEPDFILWNGVSEKQGTAGGWTTTFDNVDTQYILDEVNMCEDPEDCGVFLLVKDEGEITSKLAVIEILDPLDELKN
jgi:hypothetical protein